MHVSLPEEAKGRPGLQAMAGDPGVPAGHRGGVQVAVGQQGGLGLIGMYTQGRMAQG